MKMFAKLAALACVVFLVLQFVRPGLKNPPVTAEIQAPVQVKQILRKDCYSCHSNETVLPWFDQVVPAYWLVHHDVTLARQHLNFSEIGKLPPEAQKGMLFEAITQIQLGAMPLPSYLHVHPHAAVTPEELAILKAYLDPFAELPKVNAAQAVAADAQFHAWANGTAASAGVKPEWNGLAFFPDYKSWREISTTDRRDNHTMRVISGNDIAIKAIESKQVHPWPDGAAFAKIAWAEAIDDKGVIHAGEFKQVEFMVKDKTKYASTAGWGWGRWRGMDLKPYGKSAAFTGECVSCHKPVAGNDFVFTMPLTRNKEVTR